MSRFFDIHTEPLWCFAAWNWRGWRADLWLLVRGGASQAARAQTGLRQAQRAPGEAGHPPHHASTGREGGRGRLKQTSSTGHWLHPRGGVGDIIFDTPAQKNRFKIATKFTRDATMHTKDNWATPHLRVSICSLPNGSRRLSVSTLRHFSVSKLKSSLWNRRHLWDIKKKQKTIPPSPPRLMWTGANMMKFPPFKFTFFDS